MIASRFLPLAMLLLPLTMVLLPLATAHAQDETVRSLNPMAGIEESTLKSFVDAPLFEPSRHPPLVAAPMVVDIPPPPPTTEPPPALRLMGVVEGEHSLMAVVHRDDTGKTETVHPGDHIGGWRVEIMPVGLRVIEGDRAFDYALFRGGAQQGPVAVVPPRPPTMAERDPARTPSR